MSETLTDPLLGRLVDGRYEVRTRVASGGMATVYVAFDKRLEREIALKVMHQHLASDASEADFVARFRREAKAAARLTHPGMVRVYDQGVDGDLSYLTMEYVEGENLRQRMAHEATLPVGESLTIVERVLEALAAAHRHELVHRDVKPENVLIDDDGQPKLADFGLARAVTEVTSSSSGTVLGTAAYLAPETVSTGDADARSDVYATGILLYELVTGRQPFTAETDIEVAARHVHEDVAAPSAHVPWLPPEFDALVARLTARDPGARPDDASTALTLVRQTRAMIDDPTLDRRADPPSGSVPVAESGAETTVLTDQPSGSTVALPIGSGDAAALAVFDPVTVDDDPEALEPAQRGHRTAWWIGAVVASLLVLGGLGLWWYQAVGPGAYTTVPPVVSYLEADARDTLEGLGFVVDPEYAYDDVVPEGTVISTNPAAQQRALDGSTVTIVVSQGPRHVTIPEVVGEQESDALDALEEAEVLVGETEHEYRDDVPEGEVISITPAEGESIPHFTEVSLVVSQGPEPVEIPDLSGMTEDQARDALEEYAITLEVERERTMEADRDQIFRQSPEAGEQGLRTQTVTVVISDGPPLVTIEDYVGMAYDDAVSAATDAGLDVEVYGSWPWSSRNTIVDQSLAPNQQVERGTTITLRYN